MTTRRWSYLKNKTGTVFVVSGPSGTGKGTIMETYFSRYPNDNTFLSISATTRQPRPIDTEGVTYYFKTKEEFKSLIENDGLLEWAEFCDNYYGTPIAPIKEMIAEGKNVILEIEVQGGMQVMNKMDNAVGIFVLPPSFKELKNRLVGRNTESMDKIEKRLLRAQEEINEIDHYDYILINDDLDYAVETFRAILIGETQRVSRNKKTIKEVCETC
jgi:guanylate kinase